MPRELAAGAVGRASRRGPSRVLARRPRAGRGRPGGARACPAAAAGLASGERGAVLRGTGRPRRGRALCRGAAFPEGEEGQALAVKDASSGGLLERLQLTPCLP